MRKLTKLLCVLLGVLLMLPALAEEAPEASDTPLMEVHQMMIGFADGYLIRAGGVNILIDGGNANPRQPTDDVVNYLREAGVDRLDACIVTHWHLDHCMNLNAALAAFGDADTIVYSPAERVPEAIDNGTVTVAIAPLVTGTHQQMKMGDVLDMGGMTITCIGPETLSLGGGCNADSLNVVLQYGTRRLLFTGDFAQSRCINSAYKDLCSNVDVLKFPHHGMQPYEIGTMATRTVRPRHVLVPGVVNKHKIWDFFDNNGVKFPRDNVYTNADGHVVIITDGADRFDVLTQQNPADYAPQ